MKTHKANPLSLFNSVYFFTRYCGSVIRFNDCHHFLIANIIHLRQVLILIIFPVFIFNLNVKKPQRCMVTEAHFQQTPAPELSFFLRKKNTFRLNVKRRSDTALSYVKRLR